MKWRTALPDEPHPRCLVTVLRDNGNRYVTIGHVDREWMVPRNTVAWMPMPQHVNRDPSGWYSPYRGDDDPEKSDRYLVCQEKYSWRVIILSYDTRKGCWLGVDAHYGDILAWQPLPAPA